MDKLHRRAHPGQRERVEGRAIAATNHRDRTSDKRAWFRLELIRDITAKCSIRGHGEMLPTCARRDNERSTRPMTTLSLDPSIAQVRLAHSMREARPVAEDCR